MSAGAGAAHDQARAVRERPIDPKSALGAAAVVETYYALLEHGRTSEAAKLRRDGSVVDLKAFREFHAQVGAPAPIEGAAGSLYVVVPILIYGLGQDGEFFRRRGAATLRRANDVPGATAEQLRWRIDHIEVGLPQPAPPGPR
jgi:hypothetical protein